LLNIRGEVIGINSWIASATGGNIGIGFAIPANVAKKAVEDFIAKGRIEYGWLGITPADPAAESFPGMAEDLEIEDKTGSFVLNLVKGSPAQKSGILPGDFIVKAGDIPVRDSEHLTYVIGRVRPDTEVEFTVIRYGEERIIPVKLTARESEEEVTSAEVWPGIIAWKITKEIRDNMNLPSSVNGMLVVNVFENSPASVAGIRQGDVITEIQGEEISSDYMDFYRSLNEGGGRRVELGIWRNGREVSIGFSR
jgi:serine protease Do